MAVGDPATARAVNVVGMRRGGIDPAGRRAAQAAFRIFFRSGLAPGAALARARAELPAHPLVAQMIAFVEASRLGILSPHRQAGAEVEEPIL
jgi:UDP-N-acetylglucosamine acyltransferase